jgi:predicted permease
VAVRISIGAGRARLVRQFLTESLLLAAIGGALGLFVAVGSSRAILSSFDTGQSPVRLDVAINGTVLVFTIAVSILTGVVFGLVPAFRATRLELTRTLKEGGLVTGRGGRFAAGRLLVIGQISLCVLVIAASGLLVRSLRNLKTFDAGFQRDNILLFNLTARGDEFTSEGRAALYAELGARLRALPGVKAVAFSSRSPIDFSAETRGIVVPGFQAAGRHGVSANVVTPEYFPLFGIRLLRGRGFEARPGIGAPKVALVNEAMARFYFGTSDPIGGTFRFGTEKEFATIVGVVQDVRHEHLREAAPATVYTPIGQSTTGFDGKVFVPDRLTTEIRTTGDMKALEASVREQVRTLSKDATVWYIRTMQQQVDAALVRERLLASLSSGFGLLALLLAFVGLYGVMSYRVARRVREIGIRVALGATQARVVKHVLREAVGVAGAGIAIGLVAALATTKVVASFLFGLSPRDPAMFALVAGLLIATALIAGYLPARRAARVDPMRAFRAE